MDKEIATRISRRHHDRTLSHSSSDNGPFWKLLPAELVSLILSNLDRKPALVARLVCSTWERRIFCAHLRLNLDGDENGSHVRIVEWTSKLLTLFPKTKCFVLPESVPLMSVEEWQTLYKRPEGRVLFEWSAMARGIDALHEKQPQYTCLTETLRQAEAWSYVVDATSSLLELIPAKDPDFFDLRNRILRDSAFALSELGLYSQAMEIYEALLQHDPNNFVALNDAGIVLQYMDRWESAIPYFLRAIEVERARQADNDDSTYDFQASLDDYYYNLTNSYSECYMDDKALESVNQIVGIDPDVVRLKAQILGRVGKTAEMKALLEELLADDPTDVKSALELAVHYFDTSKYREALELVNEGIALQPEESDVQFSLWYNRGAALYELDRYDTSWKALTNACSFKPLDPNLLWRKARCALKLLRRDKAKMNFEKVIEVTQDCGRLYDFQWRARGDALLYFKRFPEALSCFERSFQMRSNCGAGATATMYYGRAAAYYATGNTAEALADICRAIELKPLADFLSVKQRIEEMPTIDEFIETYFM